MDDNDGSNGSDGNQRSSYQLKQEDDLNIDSFDLVDEKDLKGVS